MKLLSTVMILAGYTLIYAAIADHGKWATNPWLGLFVDAYKGESPKNADGSSNGSYGVW